MALRQRTVYLIGCATPGADPVAGYGQPVRVQHGKKGSARVEPFCNRGYLFAMVSNDSHLDEASPLRSFGFRLWHVRHAFTRRLDAALVPLGLTHMQYVMLRMVDYLAEAGEQPTQARLAEGAAVDRMLVSKVLRLLEAKGLVGRTAHPDDARAHHVVLTPAGQRLVAEAVPVALRIQADFFGRLGTGRMAQLGALLDELLLLEGNPIAQHCQAAAPNAAGAVMDAVVDGRGL